MSVRSEAWRSALMVGCLPVAAGASLIKPYDCGMWRRVNRSRCSPRIRKDVKSVVFSPDGQTLASASYDNTIRLWDVVTGEQKQVFTGHKGSGRNVWFSPDGQTVASASYDNTVRLWDVVTGKQKQVFTQPMGRVESVRFSPEGGMIVSGRYDDMIYLWEVKQGEQKQVSTGSIGGARPRRIQPGWSDACQWG